MENEITNTTVEDVKVEGIGAVEETAKTETVDVKAEAQKIADAMVAKKMKDMPTKEELKAYKEYQESKKTEAEKQEEIKKELELLKQEKENTIKENALLKKGVKSDDIDYVMFKVSKMDGDFNDNLELFLKDNLKFIGKEETDRETTGVKHAGGSATTKEDGVSSILKAKYPHLYN
jgi:hypothetical protein